MKKVIFSLAVLCSVALVSCGGKKTEAADTDTVAVTVAEETAVVVNDSETGVAVVEAAEVAPVADSAN